MEKDGWQMMYPAFNPNGRKKKIDGIWYYEVEVVGGHGVCSTWVTAKTVRKIRKLK